MIPVARVPRTLTLSRLVRLMDHDGSVKDAEALREPSSEAYARDRGFG
jgi:hypothetical protein